MRISIITPSYNMVDYIEDTIRSVTAQNYPDLEYIIVDGGSTDGSVERILKYEDRISKFIHEKDEGQYDAIQKGMNVATGEVMAWLNADDLYMPWTLSTVSEVFETFPDVKWIMGLPAFLNEKGQCVSIHDRIAAYPQDYIKNGWYRDHLAGYLQQESMFWRRSLWEATDGLDTSLKLAGDFKLWTEFAEHAPLVPVNTPLAAFRKRPGMQRSSSMAYEYSSEIQRITRHLKRPPRLWNRIARTGTVARSVCRLLRWRTGRMIVFSPRSNTWQQLRMIVPISRTTLSKLRLEAKMR